MAIPGYRGAVRPKHRLRSLIVISIVVVATVFAGNWAWNTAKHYGLVGPIQVPSQYRALVLDAAQRCPAISPEILAAQLVNESHWDPKATSPAGAQGIAQFMPDVWNQVGIDANDDGRVSGNRLKNTLAAYNAGHGAVRKYDGIPPYPETENYVTAIIEDSKNISW